MLLLRKMLSYRAVVIVVLVLISSPGFALSELNLPLRVRTVLVQANALLKNKEFAAAVDTLTAFQQKGEAMAQAEAESKGYSHPEIFNVLGNCYLLQKNYGLAAEAYQRVIQRVTDHAEAWLNLARANYELKQYAEAGRCFGQAYALASDKKPDHLYYSAVSYLMAENYQQSIEVFDQLFLKHPDAIVPQWQEYLVSSLLAIGKSQRALPYIRELAQTYTGSKQIQWQEILLYQYLQLGMNDDALSFARRLTEQAPTLAKWWKALTHVQLERGRQDDALTALTIYAFLTPLTLEEKKLLADLRLQAGIPCRAVPVYENCLRDVEDKAVLRRLIIAYQQLGKNDVALQRLEEFNLEPDDEDMLMLKAELLYSLEKYDQAAIVFRRVAEREGRFAGRAWLMAGYSAWQLDDFKNSKVDFVHAAKYEGTKKSALQALKNI